MARGFNYAPGASDEVQQAQKPDLSKTALAAMGQSHNKLVREIIAAREDCPLGLMVTLAHDHVPAVRIAVARNPKALNSVMAYLAADRHVDVVEALLENPSLPADILDELAFHKKPAVRKAAAARLDAGTAAPATAPAARAPELRDRVFTDRAAGAQPDGVVVNISTGEHVAPVPEQVPTLEEHIPEPAPRAPAPTRTAPVRGFRPPQAV